VLVTEQVHDTCCALFLPTGITAAKQPPPECRSAPPTRSQLIARAMSDKAVSSGKLTAAQVAQFVSTPWREPLLHLQPPKRWAACSADGSPHAAAATHRPV